VVDEAGIAVRIVGLTASGFGGALKGIRRHDVGSGLRIETTCVELESEDEMEQGSFVFGQ